MLTNVLKHAGARSVEVRVDYTPADLTVRIVDDGGGWAERRAGHPGRGLAGMWERAALSGGELHAGPGPDGGFQVIGRWPLAGPEGQ